MNYQISFYLISFLKSIDQEKYKIYILIGINIISFKSSFSAKQYDILRKTFKHFYAQ